LARDAAGEGGTVTISSHTLAVAVQAVHAQARGLQERIAVAEDPELSWLEDELLRVSKAEMELKRMYIERQETSDNLRPYGELLE
jgi:hypothetical protein